MKILLVEDNQDNADLFIRILKTAGYDVIHTLRGLDGLRASREHTFSAIILDFDLPDINGMQVCVALRRSLKHIPIIALTAKADRNTREQARLSGFNAFITKPCLDKDLLQTLHDTMQQITAQNVKAAADVLAAAEAKAVAEVRAAAVEKAATDKAAAENVTPTLAESKPHVDVMAIMNASAAAPSSVTATPVTPITKESAVPPAEVKAPTDANVESKADEKAAPLPVVLTVSTAKMVEPAIEHSTENIESVARTDTASTSQPVGSSSAAEATVV